ncbi:MAG TPA: nucleoside triphosphate pyrophosphatase [Candidatus Baltobacteraceae bacterium]
MIVLDRIVLASGSPRRLELLRSLGFDVTVAPSGYHEPPMPHLSPRELAVSHAREKLASVARVDGAATVAADTVVDLDGEALGKPRDAAEAARMLESLSGREHLVHTAYAVALPGIEAPLEAAETTRVRFHDLRPDEIAAYVATGEPMDKAGAYGIQGRAAALVAGIDGDFYTVMGFPLGGFVRALRRLGFVPPTANRAAK